MILLLALQYPAGSVSVFYPSCSVMYDISEEVATLLLFGGASMDVMIRHVMIWHVMVVFGHVSFV